MPKPGETQRKLKLLKSGKGVRPPKRWFNMLEKSAEHQYPGYGPKRIGHIVGGIWSKMSRGSKISIVKKYQR